MENQPVVGNPYVGPQTFTTKQSHLFFGREKEARDLLSLVIANRVVLFFAQSGAGKSSLINTRLIPGLEKRGFEVLPVTRIGGSQPMQDVKPQNIYAHTLMSYLDQRAEHQATFAQRTLADLLPSMTWDGEHWHYLDESPNAAFDNGADPIADVGADKGIDEGADEDSYGIQPRVLIIDQFEEILTTHPAAWEQRADFFDQLRAALEGDPYLWLVLTMREDYVGALTPFIHRMPGQLRVRYHMERMGRAAALLAVREPARLGGRDFAPGVAETLVDNLRHIRVQGQTQTELGQYLEPVQLQVVCYQLWENLGDEGMKGGQDDKMIQSPPHQVIRSSPHPVISYSDLEKSGDVDRALVDFYERALAVVLAIPKVEITERQLRNWFDDALITDADTRSTLFRDAHETGGMSNVVVDVLQSQFLLRTELRAGGAWVELVHDRFVAPIQQANQEWREEYDNPLERAYERWRTQGQHDGLLLSGVALDEAQRFAQEYPLDVLDDEALFLQRSLDYVREQALAALQKEQTRQRNNRIAGIVIAVLLLFAGLAGYGMFQADQQSRIAQTNAEKAVAESTSAAQSQATAQAASTVAVDQAKRAESEQERANAARIQAEDEARRADNQALRADNEAQRAKEEADRADDRTRRALAESLASQAQILIHRDQDYGDLPLILARDAVLTNLTPNSYAALRLAVDKAPQVYPLPITRKHHEGAVYSVVFHPDGELVISGGADGTIRIWHASDLEPVKLLFGHTGAVRAVAVSPDGKSIVSGSSDKTVRIWDLESGEQLALFKGHSSSVYAVAVTPDGQRIVSSGGDIFTMDHMGRDIEIMSGENTIRIWDIESSEQLNLYNIYFFQVSDVAVTPDGQRIVSTVNDALLSQFENTIQIWDVDSGEKQARIGNYLSNITAVAVTPNGQHIVSASDEHTIQIWDMKNGKQLARLDGYSESVSAVAVTPDEQRIVSASDDHIIRIWDIESGQQLASLNRQPEPINAVAVMPDSSSIVSGSDNSTVQTWVLGSDKQRSQFDIYTKWITAMAVTPDGQRIISAVNDHTVRVWDLQSGKQLAILKGHDGVNAVAVTPDGQRIISAGDDHTVRVWDMESGVQMARLGGHSEWVTAVAVSPDGQRIVSASSDYVNNADYAIHIWDLVSGERLDRLEGHSNNVNAMAVTPDGQHIVSASDDKTVRIWDMESGAQLTQFDNHSDAVTAVAVTPNGQRIVSASDDKTIRIWDMESGTQLAQLDSHSSAVTAVAVTPDGQRIISAYSDNIVRMWDMRSGEQLVRLDGHTDRITAVMMTPDGQHIVSASRDNTIRIWDGPERLIHKAIMRISRPAPILAPNERQRFGIGQDIPLPDQKILQPYMDQIAALQRIEQGYALAHTGAISSAVASFEQALLLDSNLDINPTIEAKQALNKRIQSLLFAGRNLADEDSFDSATAKFEKALALDDMLVNRLVAESLLSLSHSLAQYGYLDASLVQLGTAAKLDKTLDLDSLTAEAHTLAISALVQQGHRFANEGDVISMIAKFEEAVTLDEMLDLDSLVNEALPLATFTLIEQGHELARAGDVADAMTKFEGAAVLDQTLDLNALRTEAQELKAAILVRQGHELANQDDVAGVLAKIDQVIDITTMLTSVAIDLSICRLREFESLVQAVAQACGHVEQETEPVVSGIPVTGTVLGPFGDLKALDIAVSSQVIIRLLRADDSSLDPYVTLYDPDFQVVAENNDMRASLIVVPGSGLYDLELTEPGRYYIRASRCCPDNDQYTVGDYRLEVTVTEMEEPAVEMPAPTPTPISQSPLVVPTPHAPSPLATPTPVSISPLAGGG